MDSHDLTKRFIDAAEGIKASLGRRYRQSYNGLGEAIQDSRRRGDGVVRGHWEALKAFRDLRNAIQHASYLNGTPIAVPREDTVIAIELIAESVARPPQVKDHMIRQPRVLTPASTLTEASSLIIDLNLSQLPVYADGSYVGLFTTNALARWLSAAIARNDGYLLEEAATVADVLVFVEPHETPRFTKPTESAFRVCDLLAGDAAPPAVLVTTDGKAGGQLQGIVTRFDVPGILKRITTQYP